MDPKHPLSVQKAAAYRGLIARLAACRGVVADTPDWREAILVLEWLNPHWTHPQRSDAVARDVADAKYAPVDD